MVNGDEQKNAPELPIGRFLKSKSLGGNRVILAVLPKRIHRAMISRILIVGLAIVLATNSGCGGNVASNVAMKDFTIRKLPGDASKIHFALNPGIRNPNSYFEFTTSETEFLQWATQQPNVKRTDEAQFIVYRYSDYPGVTDDRGSIVVDDGYLFEWYNPSDGDHGEHIAYDKSTGRAYYWSHTF